MTAAQYHVILLLVQVAPKPEGSKSSHQRFGPYGPDGSNDKWWSPNHALALARLVQEVQTDLDQLVPWRRRGNLNKYARNLRIHKVSKGAIWGSFT
jgi:hypothetical protein